MADDDNQVDEQAEAPEAPEAEAQAVSEEQAKPAKRTRAKKAAEPVAEEAAEPVADEAAPAEEATCRGSRRGGGSRPRRSPRARGQRPPPRAEEAAEEAAATEPAAEAAKPKRTPRAKPLKKEARPKERKPHVREPRPPRPRVVARSAAASSSRPRWTRRSRSGSTRPSRTPSTTRSFAARRGCTCTTSATRPAWAMSCASWRPARSRSSSAGAWSRSSRRRSEAPMIQAESRLRVADNTGAREILCIRVRGGSKRRYARVGDIIVAPSSRRRRTAPSRRARSSRRSSCARKKSFARDDGTYIAFDDNAAVIIDAAAQPARDAHLRAGRPRAARAQLHEDRLARPGGALMAQATKTARAEDPHGRPRRGAQRQGRRPPRQGARASIPTEGRVIVEKHQHRQAPHEAAPVKGSRGAADEAGWRS